ncbi:MAG: type IV toxin-antitoxin system AbiEi family antitoxin domain-containing protein [Thermoplasmata archaeon]|nr:type IV toxin-antitoxin system AbiEi family antitoxin domain-containing protein [Thermoplasmata archaeon]
MVCVLLGEGKVFHVGTAHLVLLFIADSFNGTIENSEQLNLLRNKIKGADVYLARLQKQGKIRKIGRGKYEITPSGWKTVAYLKKKCLDILLEDSPYEWAEMKEGKVVYYYPHPLLPEKLYDKIENPKIFQIWKWETIE